VDNALRVLLLLAERDRLRVSDVAAELDIALSSAHRLLSTLRMRGFVEQSSDRSYVKGRSFHRLTGRTSPKPPLEVMARPHLTWLRDEVNETTHLSVLDGSQMRFVASVESDQVLQVGSRIGATIPAHRTSGGKALLAAFSADELVRRFPPHGLESLVLPGDDLNQLRGELGTIGRRGYGLNRADSEPGVAAVGVGLQARQGQPAGALSISLPATRFSSSSLPGMVAALLRARDALEAELAA
jgi:DNA-binding IclR family transcriptional regulator